MAKNRALLPALQLSFSAGREPNEDHAVCLQHAGVRLLAAFDGCGGAGARRYAQMDNRTGAHIASALYAQCLTEWFAENADSLPRQHIATELDALFAGAARHCDETYLSAEPSAVTGSMVRTLPSTAAALLIRRKTATLCWAGNTRAYLLTGLGMQMLTQDDSAVACDALESLYRDAPITNYLCADRPFRLHEQELSLPAKGVLVLATDGAYHALPSPMHFEALLLDALEPKSAKKRWKRRLKETLSAHAADDVTLLLQPFGFKDYKELASYFDKRRRHVNQAYILPAEQAMGDDRLLLRALWEMYQKE